MRSFVILAAAAASAVVWRADRAPNFQKPAFHARYVIGGGLRLRAAVGGAGQPTVVLLHGYAESVLSWRVVASGLAARFRVVALDLPGHGLSAKPATGYSISAMGEAVAQAISALSDNPVVLVGHSMGGALAVWVAAERPAVVSRLVLIDAAGLPGPVLSSVGRRSPTALAALLGIGAAVRTPHDPGWLAESPAESAYQPSADPAYYEALETILREFDFTGVDSLLSKVRQPTLLIWGAHDPLTPLGDGERFEAGIARSRLVVIEGALHRPHTTHPSEVERLIEAYVRSGSP